jgi:hypothetical protein
MKSTKRRRVGRLVATACLGGVLLASGCAGGKGDVIGKITFKDEAVPWGRVTFASEVGNQEVFTSYIINGKYRIQGCPPGPVKITVESRHAPTGLKSPVPDMAKGFEQARTQEVPPEVAGKYLEIPTQYAVVGESGLTYTVTSGPQTHDIPLAP